MPHVLLSLCVSHPLASPVGPASQCMETLPPLLTSHVSNHLSTALAATSCCWLGHCSGAGHALCSHCPSPGSTFSGAALGLYSARGTESHVPQRKSRSHALPEFPLSSVVLCHHPPCFCHSPLTSLFSNPTNSHGLRGRCAPLPSSLAFRKAHPYDDLLA